jgi:hypothetical protein
LLTINISKNENTHWKNRFLKKKIKSEQEKIFKKKFNNHVNEKIKINEILKFDLIF